MSDPAKTSLPPPPELAIKRTKMPVLGWGLLPLLAAAAIALVFARPSWLDREALEAVEFQARNARSLGVAGVAGAGLGLVLLAELLLAPWRLLRRAGLGRVLARLTLSVLPVLVLLGGLLWLRPPWLSVLGRFAPLPG
ncbi:MAG: hypothetical protein AAF533_28540 [Acidobacteriota bacterium]